MNSRSLILSILLCVCAGLALAQTAPAAPASTGPKTFVPADFVQFAPKTALDMLSRVPGFSIREENDERGFGEASGNVLINGQRLSGKSNDVITELNRIPAGNVEKIDIVDAATLKVPGLSGQVANVIVKSTGITGQWAYRPEFRSYYTDPLFTRFEVSLSGTKGPVQYTIGLDNRGNRSGAGGPTWIYRPDGSLMEERDEEWRGNFEQPRFSGRFVLDGPGSAVGNLSLLYRRAWYDYLETGSRIRTDGTVRDRRVTVDEHGHNYELGGDYEFGLGIGKLKFIGVGRGSRFPSEVTVLTGSPDGTFSDGDRFTQIGEEQEWIGRTEYRWTSGGAEWQVSAEGAFNSLDNTSRLFEMGTNGVFAEIPLPGGIAKVEEDRYEVMGSYGRPLSRNFTIKLLAGGEYSQLAQVGAGGTTRTFQRPKGELSASWKLSPRSDLNVKLARRVGQLNFFDFLASVDVATDIEKAANPDLVPQQSWELDVEGVRNLGEYGRTTLRLYGQRIDDIIDYVPIGVSGQSPGNLDQAEVYGFESRSTFNFDPFGWKGARLDAHLGWQTSEVEDPLTGEQRPISNSQQEFFAFDLRHDVPRSDWAWGTGYSYQLNAKNYRLTEVGRMWEGPVWGNVYLENKDVGGLTVRAGVYNLLAADSMWDRTVYSGRRTGAVAFVEHRDRQIGPIFSFSVRGKF
ncbi:MAG TPA: TonB-dependent receptor [Thermoanaerobaculia bacterium]|nr:TonB-dependent receptor [Thermoanaerobaculia bacterium]